MIDFLRSNILNKISPKDLPMVCFVVTQHSESALSLCLRYSKTSCRRQLKKSTEHTENTEKDYRRMTNLSLQPSAFSPQTSNLRLQTSDLKPQTSDFSLQPSAFSPQPSAFRPHPSTPVWHYLIHLGDSSAAIGYTVSSSSSIG